MNPGGATAVRIRILHDWDLSPHAAVALQRRLAARVQARGPMPRCSLVAGADVSYDDATGRFVGAVVLWSARDDTVVETVVERGETPFPYVPGLLSFREAPILLRALARLGGRPDLLLVDGHGLAHPRRFGLACHVGLHVDVPVVGVAKTVLVGRHRAPADRRGASAPLVHDGARIGTVLRTRPGVKPVFVSPGHRIGLAEARRAVLACCRGTRLPRPTHLADRAAGRAGS